MTDDLAWKRLRSRLLLDRSPWLRVFADDVVTTTPQGVMEGLAAFRQFGEAFATAAPDASIRADSTFEVGDTIITEGTYSGEYCLGNGGDD